MALCLAGIKSIPARRRNIIPAIASKQGEFHTLSDIEASFPGRE
jgi:hypothetical protein